MTRTYSAKALATRKRILQAANDLFYEHGFNATGIDRIIAAAEVTKGNFFYHFKNKDELAVAVLDWHRELAFTELGLDSILAEPSPTKALLRLLRAMSLRISCGTDDCRIRGCFFGNFAIELAMGNEAVQRKVGEIFEGFRNLIKELVERGQAKGEIRSDLDAERTASLILALLEGAGLLDKATQTEKEVHHALDFIASYLGQ